MLFIYREMNAMILYFLPVFLFYSLYRLDTGCVAAAAHFYDPANYFMI